MIRILLAHHEPTLRHHLARVLATAGHEVVAVDRGTRALPLISDQHFDLLLADIVMPEMDGIELAQRCAEVSPATRIMYLNGFAALELEQPRNRRELPSIGKPFHLRRLVAELQRLWPVPIFAAAGATGGCRLQAGEQAGKGTALPGEPG